MPKHGVLQHPIDSERTAAVAPAGSLLAGKILGLLPENRRKDFPASFSCNWI